MQKRILLGTVVLLALAFVGCYEPPTANDIQRDQQAKVNRQGALSVGPPNIVNFRELRLQKMILEMRDQDDLSTYTYVFIPMTGKWVHVCDSIGFPIPYSTQFSAGTAMQHYRVDSTTGNGTNYGVAQLPQPEPNGLFPPASADGTYVVCIDPKGNPKPTYFEDKLDTFLWKLPDGMLAK